MRSALRVGGFACAGLLTLAGCSSGERSPTAAPSAPSGAPGRESHDAPAVPQIPSGDTGWPSANPAGAQPAADAAPACEVELFSSVVETPDGHWDVVARARNRTPRALTLTLPKVCTGGPVEFAGIAGYDYYGRCTQGACPRPPEGRIEVVVEPRGMVDLARGRVDPKGNSCNGPVPPGRYSALVAVDLQGAVVCLGPADVMDLNPGAPAPASPAPAQKPRQPQQVKTIPPPKPCPPAVACGIACPGGHQMRDVNGCPLCACEPFGPSVTPTSTPPAKRRLDL